MGYTVVNGEIVIASESRITRQELNERINIVKAELDLMVKEFAPRKAALQADLDALRAVKVMLP